MNKYCNQVKQNVTTILVIPNCGFIIARFPHVHQMLTHTLICIFFKVIKVISVLNILYYYTFAIFKIVLYFHFSFFFQQMENFFAFKLFARICPLPLLPSSGSLTKRKQNFCCQQVLNANLFNKPMCLSFGFCFFFFNIE